MTGQIAISFDDVESGIANQYAVSLRDLLDREVECEVVVKRSDPGTMDFGSTLVLVLGSSAVSLVAKGIADWIARKPGASITIHDKYGSLIAKGIRSGDVVEILTEWQKRAK